MRQPIHPRCTWTPAIRGTPSPQEAGLCSDGRLELVDLLASGRLVREVQLVDLDEGDLGGGDILLGEDGVHRAGIDAGAAIDALVRIDVDHAVLVDLVDAVDRAHLDARLVLEVDAGLGDDVGHHPESSVPVPRSVKTRVTGPVSGTEGDPLPPVPRRAPSGRCRRPGTPASP